jgi:hypothetical protein
MKIGVEISIDATKIDKARLFEGKKGGKYLTATVFIDTDNADAYGNHGMVVHKATKEESQAKIKTPILGNVKVFWKDDAVKPQEGVQGKQVSNEPDLGDDCPF